jgi:hypothetical protein
VPTNKRRDNGGESLELRTPNVVSRSRIAGRRAFARRFALRFGEN